METWQTILLAFGGNATLLAVLVFLAKSLLEKLIVRDTKVFESQLQARTNAEIERLRNEMNRNVESYKVQLKKSEIFFQRELEAASTFSSLFHSILPGYSNPTMGWDEACDEIARDFGKIEMRLTDFMAKQAAVLTDEERKLLVDAISVAGYGKFDVFDGEVDAAANGQANELYEKLKSLESMLVGRVRAQASL